MVCGTQVSPHANHPEGKMAYVRVGVLLSCLPDVESLPFGLFLKVLGNYCTYFCGPGIA